MVVLQVGRFYYCISILLHYICYNSFWICLQSFVLFVLAVLAGGSDIVCRFLLLATVSRQETKITSFSARDLSRFRSQHDQNIVGKDWLTISSPMLLPGAESQQSDTELFQDLKKDLL